LKLSCCRSGSRRSRRLLSAISYQLSDNSEVRVTKRPSAQAGGLIFGKAWGGEKPLTAEIAKGGVKIAEKDDGIPQSAWCRCSSAERLAPASSNKPERNAQNIILTERAKGPYTS
jgi:hypothetical protein